MSDVILIMLFLGIIFGIIGFLIGDLRGYRQGLKSAAMMQNNILNKKKKINYP